MILEELEEEELSEEVQNESVIYEEGTSNEEEPEDVEEDKNGPSTIPTSFPFTNLKSFIYELEEKLEDTITSVLSVGDKKRDLVKVDCHPSDPRTR